MHIEEELQNIGLIPVAVIEKAEDAVPTAAALLDGEISAIEITLRTESAVQSIEKVSEAFPKMIVGAGTVLTIEQAKRCVAANARFIVSPGFNPELVQWCLENNVTVIPGCVTPSEIMQAQNAGISVVKFFPANVYGGLTALKALAAPFPNMGFVPTGGIDTSSLEQYTRQRFVRAVGGAWLCSKSDISSGNFDKIRQTAKEAVATMLGFEIAHVGLNTDSEKEAEEIAHTFCDMFGLPIRNGKTSNFAGTLMEVNKGIGRGEKGHIGIWTNNVERAQYYLQKRGYTLDMSSLEIDRKGAVYFNNEVGGFALHMLQK